MPKPFILTSHPGREKSKTWAAVSHYLRPKNALPSAFLNNLIDAIRLFHLRFNYNVVVLGGGAQMDMFYLVLQRLWPFNIKPVIKIDCLWYTSHPLRHFLKKRLFKWVDKAVSRYIVWASREISAYSDAFNLPRHKFVFIPYHTTVNLEEIEIKEGSYIFSGGNFARDYQTLARAVDGLDIEVIIACTNSAAMNGIRFPENVQVVGVSHQKFMQLMAQSGINVVGLEEGLLHSGGQQTFLNAMAMGKPVIVTDPEGAKDYICNGVDGLLVPPGDPKKLRSAILKLQENPDLATALGERAKKKAMKCDTENHLSAIASLAEKISLEG